MGGGKKIASPRYPGRATAGRAGTDRGPGVAVRYCYAPTASRRSPNRSAFGRDASRGRPAARVRNEPRGLTQRRRSRTVARETPETRGARRATEYRRVSSPSASGRRVRA
ncbi:Hypothetical protein CINCED_3A002236 [Cinara cedri]|uniref:Uncharacterized protein n=1 Tax=Cinara cedri TaxID=506608 RepID=A0A5E4MHF3_9HEMI|nr:Hypothetical protein CINCED_3A002236 [Cinara cedri]